MENTMYTRLSRRMAAGSEEARRPAMACLAALSLLALALPAQATWFGENVEDGADTMMMDLRYPWWAESTYNAHWNFSFNAPDNFSGYGGFAMGVGSVPPDHAPNFDPDVQAAYRPSSVWSFWGSNALGEPVRVLDTSEFNYPAQYVGEGASGALYGPCWPVIQQGRWYTMLMRLWSPLNDPNAQYALLGRWVKDVAANRWYLYGVVRIPSAATSFRGNGGFLEDFGHAGRSVRSVHRRLGYYRKDGVWKPSATVTYDVPLRDTYWVVEKQEGDTVLAMELSANPALLPQKLRGEILASGETHRFTVQQPEQPALDRPAIKDVEALSNGRQVLVSWTVPATAAPQLGYRVELFDNPSCVGVPAVVSAARMPTTSRLLIPCAIATPSVRVILTDIFDQQTEPIVVLARRTTKPTAPTSGETAPGLRYELVVKDAERHVNVHFPVCEKAPANRGETHFWVSLAELAQGRLVQQGVTHGFNIDLRGRRQQGYGFRFRGLLKVPRTGLYLFHMRGTDGYRIALDGREALTWDGLHGPTEKPFALNLAEGAHRLAVDYFVDKQSPFFLLEWEGPDLPRQAIPRTALVHEVGEALPTATLTAKTEGQGVVAAAVEVAPHGQVIERIELFLDQMQVSATTEDRLHFKGLLPAGTHTLWARIWHDGNHTVDSLAVPVTVESPAVSGWEVGVAGETEATHNILQTVPDAFVFVGEGEYIVHREIEGDFTLTCHIDQCLGLAGEPVNGASWTGLSVRERPKANRYGWGQEFGVMQTARFGLRTTPDWSDGGASRVSVQALPDGRRWLRVVRRGDLWTAWTSTDGAAWQCGAVHHKPLSATVGAGIVFRALPQDAQMYFRASISHLALVPGVPDDFALPPVTPATGTDAITLTGVVVSPSDPGVVVVRSSTRGLLRSSDGGTTWNLANGALSGAANAVRSVAIHPTNPAIMLRASGEPGAKQGGGLFRTDDGGAHWYRLDFTGDFDGTGPSALCGEVISYHPKQPHIILVGCETKGLFRSQDGGSSWERVLPAGERFTAVSTHPQDFSRDGDARIHAVTCPDRLMPLLGRGAASLSTDALAARDYFSGDSGRHFATHSERTDLGYLNLTYSDPNIGTLEYGTTHGLLHTFTGGQHTYLFSTGVTIEALRPITALSAGWVKDQAWPRVYAQALVPAVPDRMARCDYARDMKWRWYACTGTAAAGAIAITPCDLTASTSGRYWWILSHDGLYRLDHEAALCTRALK